MSEFMFEKEELPRTRIKVIGVGGGGCNAVDSMVNAGLPGVEFYAVNTDLQALSNSKCANKIQIGKEMLLGRGAGGDPKKGEDAAVADRDLLVQMLEGGEMAFISACLGGGTGTGAAPVIAQLAREMGLLTIGIVTKPFMFEGPLKRNRAQQGIDRLREFVDSLIVVMNDKLLESVGAKTPLLEAFAMVNQILAQGVQSISDLISMPGLINADFEDVRSVMGATGGAVLGVGIGKGENRAVEAVKKACSATLQEKIVIDGAKRVLISLTGGPDMTLKEVNDAASQVFEAADKEANIILSAVIDERLTDEIRVTIMATGFGEETSKLANMAMQQRERQLPPRHTTPQAPKPARGTLSNSAVQAEFGIKPLESKRGYMEDEFDELHEPHARKNMGFGDTVLEPEVETPLFEIPQPSSVSATLPSWNEEIETDSFDEETAQPPTGLTAKSASSEEDNFKTNMDLPAIIRRRKSYFS